MSKRKLQESFYARHADVVAWQLLGRDLVVRMPSGRELHARLTEVAAYEGDAKTMSEGALHQPGIVTISTKYNQKLIDISTGKAKVPACVTFKGAVIKWSKGKSEKVIGPGNLAKKLAIVRETELSYNGQEIYGNKIWIEGEGVEMGEINRREGNAPNCLGIYYLR